MSNPGLSGVGLLHHDHKGGKSGQIHREAIDGVGTAAGITEIIDADVTPAFPTPGGT